MQIIIFIIKIFKCGSIKTAIDFINNLKKKLLRDLIKRIIIIKIIR